jgi:hypothetical protein
MPDVLTGRNAGYTWKALAGGVYFLTLVELADRAEQKEYIHPRSH